MDLIWKPLNLICPLLESWIFSPTFSPKPRNRSFAGKLHSQRARMATESITCRGAGCTENALPASQLTSEARGSSVGEHASVWRRPCTDLGHTEGVGQRWKEGGPVGGHTGSCHLRTQTPCLLDKVSFETVRSHHVSSHDSFSGHMPCGHLSWPRCNLQSAPATWKERGKTGFLSQGPQVATLGFSPETRTINWIVINSRGKVLTNYIEYNKIPNHKAEPAGLLLHVVVT